MLALKDEKWESGLSGIACLATPFLVLREAAWARQGTTVSFAMIALAGWFWIFHWMDSRLLSVVMAILLTALLFGLFSVVLTRHENFAQWTYSPGRAGRRVPLLIVRCPGDEAGGVLGFVTILARIVYYVEHKAAWPIRMIDQHPIKLFLVSMGVVAGLTLQPLLSPGAPEFWDWKTLFLLVLGVLVVGLPLRLLIYGLAYGWDLMGLLLTYSLSAETTPVGPGTTWLVEPPNTETLRSAHNEIYELPKVYDIIAESFLAIVEARNRPTML
jgi:hypothetical protein